MLAPDPTTEPRSKSGPGLCVESPDGRHWWDKVFEGQQSLEVFECRWCHNEYWD